MFVISHDILGIRGYRTINKLISHNDKEFSVVHCFDFALQNYNKSLTYTRILK